MKIAGKKTAAPVWSSRPQSRRAKPSLYVPSVDRAHPAHHHRSANCANCSPKRCAGGTSKQQRVTGVACNPHPAFVRFSLLSNLSDQVEDDFLNQTNRRSPKKMLERATGIEPVTSSLGSWHSTAELRPLSTDRSR